MPSYRILALALVAAVANHASAQHDAHRNATQSIAAGNLRKAEQQLAKAPAGDPETSFVQMMLALKQGNMAQAEGHARDALDRGLPLTRLAVGPRELLTAFHRTDSYRSWARERGVPKLIHGPMLGSVTATGASCWVRTSSPAKVQIRIGEDVSPPVMATAESDFTAVARITGLSPNTMYDYQVLMDGQVASAGETVLRTFPARESAGEFSIAFGGGAGYVPKWERMWDTIGTQRPIAMLMLGDNVYIDQPQHSLCQHYCYYRRQDRPEWRRLVAQTPVFAIYDDHDFGTNDCIPGPHIEQPAWKRSVWNIFRQNWANPAYGGGEKQPGCWFDFYIGDVHVILIDGRYYRDLRGGTMLGPAQKAWLKRTLRDSQGVFKLLASPVPWTPGIKPGSKDPWDGFPQEREEIFSFLETHKIDGVVLVSADRHRTDLRTTERPDGYTLYEFESSKLTNRHTHPVVKTSGLVWGYNKKCSFGLMKFDTRQADPVVVFQCITIDGELVHSHELRASQLRSE